jgi:hypothetical protein
MQALATQLGVFQQTTQHCTLVCGKLGYARGMTSSPGPVPDPAYPGPAQAAGTVVVRTSVAAAEIMIGGGAAVNVRLGSVKSVGIVSVNVVVDLQFLSFVTVFVLVIVIVVLGTRDLQAFVIWSEQLASVLGTVTERLLIGAREPLNQKRQSIECGLGTSRLPGHQHCRGVLCDSDDGKSGNYSACFH